MEPEKAIIHTTPVQQPTKAQPQPPEPLADNKAERIELKNLPKPVQPKKPTEQPASLDMADMKKETSEVIDAMVATPTEEVIAIVAREEPNPETDHSAYTEVADSEVGTSITYSVDDVKSKFLKKDLQDEATPDKESTSGLQKVIATVVNSKNEESVFTGLRKKKNDFLRIDYPTKDLASNK